jgi:hypothetical protein
VRERSEASAAPGAADSQRLKEDDEEEEGPVSLRKRSFASSERVRDLGGKAEMVDGSSRQRARKRCGGQRWWMGVADRARERSGGVEMCRASSEACRVVRRGLCAMSRESRGAMPVVQCQWCSASGAVPVQQCQRYGLCYVARGVAAPPRSRRSCSVGEAPLVVVPNSWPQWTRRRRAPPGHAKAQGRRTRRGHGRGCAGKDWGVA